MEHRSKKEYKVRYKNKTLYECRKVEKDEINGVK